MEAEESHDRSFNSHDNPQGRYTHHLCIAVKENEAALGGYLFCAKSHNY